MDLLLHAWKVLRNLQLRRRRLGRLSPGRGWGNGGIGRQARSVGGMSWPFLEDPRSEVRDLAGRGPRRFGLS